MTRRALLVPLAALALAAAGCGSSDGSSSATGASTGASSSGGAYGSGAASTPAAAPASASGALRISAEESSGLSFDHRTLSARAGTVTITMANPAGDSQPHGVAVTGPGGVSGSGRVVQPGGSSTVALKLRPGRYTFFCPVPGHRQAGMEGTLTVR